MDRNRSAMPPCPIDVLRRDVLLHLERSGTLVVSAPPGSGKSTRIPLWLLQEKWLTGRKILLLEPRRVAARALARHMAFLIGERPGQSVGWRMRGETLVSRDTRIEVVTEGVLTRLLQNDPELPGTGCVIFDEFHERSLQTDLGLALSLESQATIRPDLRLLVMSATIDAAAAAGLMGGCARLECSCREFPVALRWAPPPKGHSAGLAFWRHAANVIRNFLLQEPGNLLAFLPGTPEIRLLATLLEDVLPRDVLLCPLHGSLSSAEQDMAIALPPSGKRKVVLATSIAETSLTIEGVRLVVDSGLSRFSRFDPASGIDRLATERLSLAGVKQRTGRAGRTAPGICCRLWHKEEERGLLARPSPEILRADLSGLVLQLAAWGATTDAAVAALAWSDPPPPPALAKARQTLASLEAIDNRGNITELGRAMAALPVSPRIARILLYGLHHGHLPLSCCLAALLEDHDPLRQPGGEQDCGMMQRLDWLCGAPASPLQRRLRRWTGRLAAQLGFRGDVFSPALADHEAAGMILAAGWPDRVARRVEGSVCSERGKNGRDGKKDAIARFILRTGQSVWLPAGDSVANAAFLVAVTVTGNAANGRVRTAAAISEEQFERCFADQICIEDRVTVTPEGHVRARRRTSLGAMTLREEPLPHPEPAACARALCGHIRQGGERILAELPWEGAPSQWRARVSFLHRLDGPPWPDMSDATLLETLAVWLEPFLVDCTSIRQLDGERLLQALQSLLPRELYRRLDVEAPTGLKVPSGNWHPVV